VAAGLAHLPAQHVLGCALSLVQQECTLQLVLPLLVSGRCGFDADIPAMVVHVSGVSARVRRLRRDLGVRFIKETLLNQKLFLGLFELLVREELVWLRHTVVPPVLLGAQEVSVDFVLHDSSDPLCLFWHVLLLVEERVVGVVVDLSVLDAANGLSSCMKAVGRPTFSHYVFTGTDHQVVGLQELLLLILLVLRSITPILTYIKVL